MAEETSSPPNYAQSDLTSERSGSFHIDQSQQPITEEQIQSPDTPPVEAPQPDADFDTAPLPFLRKQNGASIYVYHHREPWRLVVNTLALPFETFSGFPRDKFLKYLMNGEGGSSAASQIDRAVSEWERSPQTPLWIPLPADVVQPTPSISLPGNGRHQVSSLADVSTGLTPIRQIVVPTLFSVDDDPSTSTPTLGQVRVVVTAVIQQAAQRGIRGLAIPILMEGDREIAVAMLRAIDLAVRRLRRNPIQAIVLITLNDWMVPYLLKIGAEQASLTPSNDLAKGDDALNVAVEAYSLAEMLMLRDVEPPLCVGILGGWGSGKSFFMHLMQQKMNEIRSMPLAARETWVQGELKNSQDDLSELVGHIYQIEFNAWTYAKSNLWASLMQTIFSELNRQMTLEKRLEALDLERFDPLRGGDIWRILNKMPADTQDALLTTELGRETLALEAFRTDPHVQETADSLWSALQSLRETEQEALDEIEQEKNERKISLAKAKAEIAEQVAVEIDAQARAAIWEPFKARLTALWTTAEAKIKPIKTPGFIAGKEIMLSEKEKSEAASTTFALQFLEPDTLDTIRWLWSDRDEKGKFVAILLFWLAGILTPFILNALDVLPGLGGMAAAVLVLPSLQPLGRLFKEAKKLEKELNNLRQEFQTTVKNRIDELEASRTAREQTLQTEAGIPEEERELAQLEARAEWHRQRVGLTANYVSIVDFVNSRLDTGAYARQLGLMQQVHADLEELTNGLIIHEHDVHREKKQELFKRGPVRVVLFIDDLDRCPPDRVVEVFEAAQLLLKTQLFVVVLALDVRYVSRALEKVYQGILSRQGDPSGMDYIEKIIQIPYRIRPVDDDALPGYLEQQMKRAQLLETAVASTLSDDGHGQVDGGGVGGSTAGTEGDTAVTTSVTQAIEFSDDEQAIISVCCREVELTPRSIKRFINVFKLIKLIWNRGFKGNQSIEVNGAIGLLLTLSARYPELMRGVFDYLWQAFKSSPDDLLDNLLNQYELPAADDYLKQDFEQWQQTVNRFVSLPVLKDHPDFHIGNTPLSQLGEDNFNLIRSLCFVGDVGRDGPPPRQET